MRGTWNLLVSEVVSLERALRGAERVCGVRLAVSVERVEDTDGVVKLMCWVRIPNHEHMAEVQWPREGLLPIWDTRLCPLEVQLIAGVQAYLYELERHMSARS